MDEKHFHEIRTALPSTEIGRAVGGHIGHEDTEDLAANFWCGVQILTANVHAQHIITC